jgi:hypothetical protein
LLLVLVAAVSVDKGVLGEHKEVRIPLPVYAVLQVQDSIFDSIPEIHVSNYDEKNE